MKPTPREDSLAVLKRLLQYIKPYRALVVLIMILALMTTGMTLYVPILTGRAVDHIIGKGNVDYSGLLRIFITIGVAVGISALTQQLMSVLTNKLAFGTIQQIRTDAFEKLSGAKLGFLDRRPHGDLISRIVTDTDQISDGLLMGFTQLFTGVVTIAGTLIFMLSVNVKIALVVILLTPLSLFVAKFIASNTFKMFRIQSETRGELTGYINEILGNQKLVRAFGMEEPTAAHFEEINQRLKVCGVRALFFSALVNPCTRFINGLVYAGVGIFGAFTAISGGITVGQLSAFLSYANQFAKPFNEISGVITELQSALASAKRVLEIIDRFEQEESPDTGALPADDSAVLENVGFSYRPDQKLIEGLNLRVRTGEMIALVGPTGCGKTTFINLLMRFYDVTAGEIRLGGCPVKELPLPVLRGRFGMVLQDTWLKTATVAENIAYGFPAATREQIEQAAKRAFADSFIRRLPQGYDTVISEDGGNISHGQKQLLCIARVMLSLPPMLILDEATSSIDTMTEIRIRQAFDRMTKGRTSFIVAHRLSTIQGADCILVMNQGSIVEQGTHEELIAKNGFYANLYQNQFAQDEPVS